MKRWLPWFAMPVLACIVIIVNRASAPFLLKDTDTAVLLRALDARHDPLSWFHTDWPLQNHFYRPVSTLFFEFDNAAHPGNAAGFGLTNALLAVACVLLLFWLVRELTEKPWLAGLSSGLFGLWHLSPLALSFLDPLCWALSGVALLGLLHGIRKKVGAVVLGALTLAFVSTVWAPVSQFNDRIVAWLPGRTASTMTVFALAAMAAYCRFERLSAERLERKAPSATDVPATKGTEAPSASGQPRAWLWCGLAAVCTALALGCYEQAVMLPGVLVGCAVMFRVSGRRPHVWPHVVFWGLLVAYFAVRTRFVLSAPSGYQEQQFRTGGGVLIAIMDYVFPGWNWGRVLGLVMASGIVLLVTSTPWVLATFISGNVASWVAAWKDALKWQVLGWFALSVLAFLPMAWLQPFGHYHYWPSALRSVYAIGLAAVGIKALTSAVARPTLRAPIRLSPAPGSLPRP